MNNYKAQHIRRREKNLVCDYVVLNDFDIKVLLTDAAYSKEFIAQLVLSSLLCGWALEAIVDSIDLVKTSQKHSLAVLPSSIKYPQVNILPEFENYVTQSTHVPFAILPVEVSSILTSYKLSESEKSDINKLANEYLRTLNAEHKSRLTLARISTYINSVAYQFCISDAELVWAKGLQLKAHAGASYLQVQSTTFVNKLLNFINACYEKASLQSSCIKSNLIDELAGEKRIGSSLQIKQEVLKAHFKEIRCCLGEIKSSIPLDVIALHNYLTYYTLLVLNITTGHRPRNGSYRKTDFFDLEAGTVLIFDKENRGPGTTRVLPLAEIASQQLKNYLSHLQFLNAWFQYDNTKIASQIVQVLQNERSLFNVISNSALTLVTQQNIEKVVPEKIGLKSNWHRHWLRSKLANDTSLSPSVINYYMGHEGKLDESYSRFSTLSFLDLKHLITSIQNIAESLTVIPVEGLTK
jgi:hypothetical protein